jgi:hypothetical protein
MCALAAFRIQIHRGSIDGGLNQIECGCSRDILNLPDRCVSLPLSLSGPESTVEAKERVGEHLSTVCLPSRPGALGPRTAEEGAQAESSSRLLSTRRGVSQF